MANHSVVAWNELYDSEANWASVFCLTSFLRKVLLSSRSRLVHFAMSTSMAPEGSEIFHRKESFLVSLLASEGKTDEGQEFDPIHDRRVNGKSFFATFQARRS